MDTQSDHREEALRRVRDAIERRRAAGQSWEEISVEFGVAASTLWKWSQGRIRKSTLTLLALSHEAPTPQAA
jgi:hypothetical protein